MNDIRNWKTYWLGSLVILGLLARFVLAWISWGTNDADSFARFGYHIANAGLLQTYRTDSDLNHPPIPSLWCELVWRLTDPAKGRGPRMYPDYTGPGSPGKYFAFIFKTPSLIAECISTWLIYLVWKKRRGEYFALLIAAGYAWCLSAILICGFHGNTDPIYTMLCFAAVYLIAEHGRYFLAGVALAAAINIKLSPALLIIPLAISLFGTPWKRLLKFSLGVSLGVVPFIPVLLFARSAFISRAVEYRSSLDHWGIPYLLMQIPHRNDVPNQDFVPGEIIAKMVPLADAYHNYGRWLLLAAVVGWSVLWRIRKEQNIYNMDLYNLAGVTLALFLFLASGFGVQYAGAVIPLMFVVRPGIAAIYGLISGLFLLIVYYAESGGQLPKALLYAHFGAPLPWPATLWGLAAWVLLGAFIAIGAFWPRRI